jgi:outer membrane lipoprotein LolB
VASQWRTIAAICLLLTGCSNPNTRPRLTDQGFEVQWALAGRLAISKDNDGGSGELGWRQGESHASLDFVGTLGRGSWRLDIAPGLAELKTADGGRYSGVSVEQLLSHHFDRELPVTALRFWVRGEPSPDSDYQTQRDSRGQLTSLQQSGWQIRFDGVHRVGDRDLPRRITATRGGDRVRLVIREWLVRG